jgi:hypothetical protein
MGVEGPRGYGKWINLLLLVPLLAVLYVPLYNFDEPRIIGFPFFYAWQIAWVVLGASITGFVYFLRWRGRDE